jgi:hypothetical protein
MLRDRRSRVDPVSVAARPALQRLSGGMPKIASRGATALLIALGVFDFTESDRQPVEVQL